MHYVLDEIIMAGMVLETNIIHILQVVTDQNRLHAASQKAVVPAGKARTPTLGGPGPGAGVVGGMGRMGLLPGR